MQKLYHCDLSAIQPGSEPALSAARLISEPGLYERTFHPERKKFWVKNDDDSTPKASPKRSLMLAEFL